MKNRPKGHKWKHVGIPVIQVGNNTGKEQPGMLVEIERHEEI